MTDQEISLADKIVTAIIIFNARPGNSLFGLAVLALFLFFVFNRLLLFYNFEDLVNFCHIVTYAIAGHTITAVFVICAPLSESLAIILTASSSQKIVLANKFITTICVSFA